ncbi:hypothetical protein KW783_01055 [Candidatus Parcubacteria bacterium]|nr:hypothetical protein [Candidatus Parcubacteria bacterium]
MANRWTVTEESAHREILQKLYIEQNLSLSEISKKLSISQSTLFDRLNRLSIKTTPHLKTKYQNRRSDITIPEYSDELAEFIGIMLGDGHISHFQTIVTLGTKEKKYVEYVAKLFEKLFGVKAKITRRKNIFQQKKYYDVYVGSVSITKWLNKMGMVQNKVKSQVDVPEWIFSDQNYVKSFIRGFFDTDGSIYKLRHGIQLSFSNRSAPLLNALQKALMKLEFSPSKVSFYKVYLTKIADVKRFFEEIKPKNPKHTKRFLDYASVV